VIFALSQPATLLGLLIGFLVGVSLRAAAQRRLVGAPRARGRRPLSAVGAARVPAPRAGYAAYLDPYGTVAAVIGGPGWGPRPASRRGRWDDVLLLVAALVVHALLAVVGLAVFSAVDGPTSALAGIPVSDILHGNIDFGSAGQEVAVGFAIMNLACGLLALLPIPPLELGIVLWGRLPRSPGSRRFAYHLLEEQWGVAIVLVLLLLPLGGELPLLLVLVNKLAEPLLRLF
jgi:hypothetical protein